MHYATLKWVKWLSNLIVILLMLNFYTPFYAFFMLFDYQLKVSKRKKNAPWLWIQRLNFLYLHIFLCTSKLPHICFLICKELMLCIFIQNWEGKKTQVPKRVFSLLLLGKANLIWSTNIKTQSGGFWVNICRVVGTHRLSLTWSAWWSFRRDLKSGLLRFVNFHTLSAYPNYLLNPSAIWQIVENSRELVKGYNLFCARD